MSLFCSDTVNIVHMNHSKGMMTILRISLNKIYDFELKAFMNCPLDCKCVCILYAKVTDLTTLSYIHINLFKRIALVCIKNIFHAGQFMSYGHMVCL